MTAPVRADGTRHTPLLPSGTEALEPFVDAGVLREADVQVAGAIGRVVPGTSDEVLLAAALCVRALSLGHVCIEIDAVAARIDADAAAEADGAIGTAGGEVALGALRWPEPAAWAGTLRSSAAVAVRDTSTGAAIDSLDPSVLRPLVFDGSRVYLERYWRYERQVGDALLAAPGAGGPEPVAYDETELDAALDRCFGSDPDGTDLQRRSAAVALRSRITVLAGGPGTGKTHTVARLLGALHDLSLRRGMHLQVALAAPTGKAAARMTEAVHEAAEHIDLPAEVTAALRATEGSTLHRLLGYRDGVTFRHDRTNPLPHDVVVVDETSMVALPLMARLLDALRPEARLVLVGDPFQLASVEAGAVLGDIVGPAARGATAAAGPLADRIVVLEGAHRFAESSGIAALAAAVRAGDAEEALAVLRDPRRPEVTWVQPDDVAAVRALRATVLDAAAAVALAARSGDAEAAHAAALELKVLCGTRFGATGSYAWRDHIERRLPRLVEGMRTDDRWYAGRPVIVTANDSITGVFNGDTGLVVRDGERTAIVMAGATGLRRFATAQLAAVETWWAMTIHKSQGSEFDHAVVSLPGAGSRVLTNELLYTAVTRGRRLVTVLATEEALRTAIATPVARASGLGSRLWS